MPLKPLPKTSKTLPPIIKSESKDWRSSGVSEKPAGCEACKYSSIGAGFCGDDNPKGKKLMILCSAPTKGEILEQIPWHGPQGWIYTKFFLDEAGIPRNEVFISHVIRCRPPFKRVGGSDDSYPKGADRRNAELTCRQFDNSHTYRGDLLESGIKEFAPDTFLVTFPPEKALEVTAYKRIIQEDIKKAWRLVGAGRRVCVLMGTPAFELVADGLEDEGGVKTWRGHYWSGMWGYDTMTAVKPRFAAPERSNRWRRG